MRKAIPVALVALAVALPAPSAAGWSKPKQLVVRGQVTDDRGQGIEGIPVRVLATRRVARFLSVESQPAEKELAATRTGPNGFYELAVPKVRDYDFYFLRFYDSGTFDTVRFALPEDVEITSWIRKRRPAVQDIELQPAAGWDAVRRLLDLYGADSVRGRIVRQLGVPERTERTKAPQGVDRETWWYDTAGVAYVIEDGEVLEKKTFQPRQESLPLARK